VLTVPGTTTVNASGKDITLANAGNELGTVVANGAVVSIRDTNALALGDVTATGGLILNTGDVITQTGNITTTNLSLTTSSDNVTLNSANNNITGTVTAALVTGDLTLRNGGSLTLGAVTADNATLTANGSITGSSGAVVLNELAFRANGAVTIGNSSNGAITQVLDSYANGSVAISNNVQALTLNNIYVGQDTNGTSTVSATTSNATITLAGRITGDTNASNNYLSSNGASVSETSNTYLQGVRYCPAAVTTC
jgi:hypothetical protein